MPGQDNQNNNSKKEAYQKEKFENTLKEAKETITSIENKVNSGQIDKNTGYMRIGWLNTHIGFLERCFKWSQETPVEKREGLSCAGIHRNLIQSMQRARENSPPWTIERAFKNSAEYLAQGISEGQYNEINKANEAIHALRRDAFYGPLPPPVMEQRKNLIEKYVDMHVGCLFSARTYQNEEEKNKKLGRCYLGEGNTYDPLMETIKAITKP